MPRNNQRKRRQITYKDAPIRWTALNKNNKSQKK